MRVTVVQMNSQDDKSHNLAEARRLAAEAVAADRPDLIVFPEMVSLLGGTEEARQEAAEEIPGGETWKTMQSIAREHGVFVHGGSFYERIPDDTRSFNTTVAFGRDGEELARYRKIHLFDITAPDGTEYRESDSVGRGKDLAVYEAEGIRVGCTICYDLRFGELYRGLAGLGADLIMVPAAFTLQTGKDHWEILLRSRAIEMQTYIAASGQSGSFPTPEGQRHCWGHSMIVDPWGYVAAQVSDGIGFATATIDPGYVRTVRQRIPMEAHRVLGN